MTALAVFAFVVCLSGAICILINDRRDPVGVAMLIAAGLALFLAVTS